MREVQNLKEEKELLKQESARLHGKVTALGSENKILRSRIDMVGLQGLEGDLQRILDRLRSAMGGEIIALNGEVAADVTKHVRNNRVINEVTDGDGADKDSHSSFKTSITGFTNLSEFEAGSHMSSHLKHLEMHYRQRARLSDASRGDLDDENIELEPIPDSPVDAVNGAGEDGTHPHANGIPVVSVNGATTGHRAANRDEHAGNGFAMSI